MDAEARTGTRILAAVGPQGATYAEIAAKSGVTAGERLEAALRALVTSGVLVRRNGVFYQPPVRVDRSDVERARIANETRIAQCRESLALARTVQQTEYRKTREERYALVLRLRREGKSYHDIARAIGQTVSSARKVVCRARGWEAGRA